MLMKLRPLLGGDAVAGDGSVGDEVVEARDRAGKVDDRVGLTGALGRAMRRGIGRGYSSLIFFCHKCLTRGQL